MKLILSTWMLLGGFILAASQPVLAGGHTKNSVVLARYSAGQTLRRGMPTMRDLLALTNSHPSATQFRLIFDFDGIGGIFQTEVQFDRRRQRLLLIGRNWTQGDHRFLYFGVNKAKLQEAIKQEKHLGYRGCDSNFFILAKVGCEVKDMETGKVLSYQEVKDLCF